jgi:chemotaxis protein MotB
MSGKHRAGAPSWMVTFADLMALLTTFFVLLLSFSEQDAERYRQIAGSMATAFSGQWFKGNGPYPGSGPVQPIRSLPYNPPAPEAESAAEPPRMDSQLLRFRGRLQAEIAKGLIEVSRNRRGELMISFRHEAAFHSGSRELIANFQTIIDRIAGLLATTRGTIIVAGHTDDLPIHTEQFRSNWDLSTARAATVVHALIAEGGIAPRRLVAQGYGDSRPLVPNDTPQHRARNRRVEIRILNPLPPSDASNASTR